MADPYQGPPNGGPAPAPPPGAPPAGAPPPPPDAGKSDRDLLSPEDQQLWDLMNGPMRNAPGAEKTLDRLRAQAAAARLDLQTKADVETGKAKVAAGEAAQGRAQGIGDVFAGRGNQDYANTQDSRAGVANSIGLLAGAANGTAPSLAEIVGRERTDAANAAALSQAAGARGGPGAQAAATRAAINAGAQNQQQNVRDTMAARAGEMATARGQLANATLAAHQADLGAYGQDVGQQFGYEQLGQGAALGYSGQGVTLANTATNADVAHEGNANAKYANDIARDDANARFGIGTFFNAAGAVTDAAGRSGGDGGSIRGASSTPKTSPSTTGPMGGGSSTPDASPQPIATTGVSPDPDKRAHGGVFSGVHPLLVGEEGPEIIVPQAPGYVLTAQQTAALRGAPPTEEQRHSLAALYGAPARPAPRPATLGEALAGLESLKRHYGR